MCLLNGTATLNTLNMFYTSDRSSDRSSKAYVSSIVYDHARVAGCEPYKSA